MYVRLINEPDLRKNGMEQVLYNRGISEEECSHYMNLGDEVINSPECFGEDLLKAAVKLLFSTILENKRILVIVDCDCDGYTSAALMINYLYKICPEWTENNVKWFMHDGKTHGLSDSVDEILTKDYGLIICPDSSSNDYEEHKRLQENGKKVLILDHHLADHISENAITINNQLSDYPNKQLSGVGVVWQFCRYIDKVQGTNYTDDLLDLVALGNCGDMMSLLSFETKRLIIKGFSENNIHNPFIKYMINKNAFPLSKSDYKSSNTYQACTSIGAAFFIVPFVNATTRSGTLEEKELIFKSMLDYAAYERIPEIKRGKPTGNTEHLVAQAARVIGNIKNRQTRAEEAGMEKLEAKIKAENLLDHKMLLLLLEPGEVAPEIRGLIANKFMAKYQRPCAILTYTERDGVKAYEGSMRGYTRNGLSNLKGLIENLDPVLYVQGHENAAGLGIKADKVDEFLSITDQIIKGSEEPIYRVDYFFKEDNIENHKYILDIAQMNDFWGQDVERGHVAIEFLVTPENFSIMKANTLKVTLKSGLSLIKFRGTEDDIEAFTTQGAKRILAYCKCNANEWNGHITPQLIIEDYEIINDVKYLF